MHTARGWSGLRKLNVNRSNHAIQLVCFTVRDDLFLLMLNPDPDPRYSVFVWLPLGTFDNWGKEVVLICQLARRSMCQLPTLTPLKKIVSLSSVFPLFLGARGAFLFFIFYFLYSKISFYQMIPRALKIAVKCAELIKYAR